jgi:8-oxo-dGTP diphosphatase
MPKFRMPTLTLTTDIVIFTIRDERLEILLIERGNPPYQGRWALPGGLVEEDEDLDVCAHRELEEETRVTDVSLEQLHTFGAPHRDPRGRLVTVAYYTLVRAERLHPAAASDAANVRWFAVEALPSLAFDHAEIIAMARRRLRARLDESVDAFGFLPKTFTTEDLRTLVEIVGGRRLDPQGFRRRVLALELIEDTGKTTAGTRRPARLYCAVRRKSC